MSEVWLPSRRVSTSCRWTTDSTDGARGISSPLAAPITNSLPHKTTSSYPSYPGFAPPPPPAAKAISQVDAENPMNHRLLTEEEKAQSKSGRIQRRAARAWLERREKRQLALANQHGLALQMAFMTNPTDELHPALAGTGAQAAKFKTVLSLNAVCIAESWADQRIWDTIQFHDDSENNTASESASEPMPLRTPSTLQRTKRSPICPNTINQPPPPLPPMSPIEFNKWSQDNWESGEAMKRIEQECQQQTHFYALPEEMKRRAHEAAKFWSWWQRGKSMYHSGRRHQIVPDRGPRWACFDNYSLSNLLPGIRMPKKQHRLIYWALMTKSLDRQVRHIDFYGEALTPLFRHPFPMRNLGDPPIPCP